ncbi:MAG: helix-turn-helix transcriptional regulator [Coriobacteriales bacterium]|nr:helix-turn-helix transcriptional regulator [Coriobacteriales bacterium]
MRASLALKGGDSMTVIERVAPGLSQYLKEPWFKAAVFGLGICFVIRSQNNFAINQMIGASEMVSSSLPLISIGSIIALIAYALYAFSHKDQSTLFLFKDHRTRVYAIAAVAVFALGAIILCNYGILKNELFLIIAKVTIGIANSLLIIAWAEFFISLGREAVILGLSASVVVSAAFQLLFAAIYNVVLYLVLLILPLISCMLLDRACALHEEETDEETTPISVRTPATRKQVIAFFFSIILYHFLANSLRIIWVQSYAVASNSALFQVSAALGVALSGVIIFYAIFFTEEETNVIYLLLVAIMLVSAFYLRLFLKGAGVFFYIVPLYIAYWVIFFVIWNYALAQKTDGKKLSFVVFGLLAIEAGKFLNLGLFALMTRWEATYPDLASNIISLILLAMLAKELISLFVWQKRELHKAEVELAQTHNVGRFKSSCTKICENGSLSPRETEIFMYLARGRDVEYIANKLVIEKVTVKTHVVRIYRKLGINSHQQLIDLVEDEMSRDAE